MVLWTAWPQPLGSREKGHVPGKTGVGGDRRGPTVPAWVVALCSPKPCCREVTGHRPRGRHRHHMSHVGKPRHRKVGDLPEATRVGHDRAGAPRPVQRVSPGGSGTRRVEQAHQASPRCVGGSSSDAELCGWPEAAGPPTPPGVGDRGAVRALDRTLSQERTASLRGILGGSTWETHTPRQPPPHPRCPERRGGGVSLPFMLPVPGNTASAE